MKALIVALALVFGTGNEVHMGTPQPAGLGTVPGTQNVVLPIDIQPNEENIWMVVVVIKPDGDDIRHAGFVEGITHVDDLWPNMPPGTYKTYAILQRLKSGTTDQVTDYESNYVTFTLGKPAQAHVQAGQ